MFEKYGEDAIQVLRLARIEASIWKAPTIEPEHFLLPLVDSGILGSLLRGKSPEELRDLITRRTKKGNAAHADELPLSSGCKRIIVYADEEAQRLGHRSVTKEHILLGVLREKGGLATEILREWGLQINKVREEIARRYEEA